jgi:glycosyltransferase involved in cell wall biosynthesis
MIKISIITVSYNSAATLGDTLRSVAGQTYKNVEHILVDGASKDDTVNVVHNYGRHLAQYVSESDRGIYDAMNKGILLATGDVIGILNSDDFYTGNRVLEDVSKIFMENPEIKIVMGNIDFVNGENLFRVIRRVKSKWFVPWMMRFGLTPPHPAVFIKKSVYDHIGLYKLNYKIAADFEYFVRIFLKDNVKYKILDQQMVRMRTGGASTSGWLSTNINTKEMLNSFFENKLYTNYFMLLLRLPIKYFLEVFLTRLKRN